MTQDRREVTRAELKSALEVTDPSARLQAALTAGMYPSREYVKVLIGRCAVEPDFFVRDMLTWALIRQDPSATVDLLLDELSSDIPQARSQALHTLSKIGDPRAWVAITPGLLRDDDDEVARAAWRTAVGLVPEGGEADLAATLATQFNRGGREVQLSLSRAFATLGEASSAAIERAMNDRDAGVRAHAIATERLMKNPDEEFDAAIRAAKRLSALLGAPLIGGLADADR